MRRIPLPKAVLFDLFHTLACVPTPAASGELPIPEILGVSDIEWQRLYYDADVLGRCLGHVQDGVEAMRRIAHSMDPSIDETRILAAVESRRRRFETGLIGIEAEMLTALDRLRAAGIRTALVSDAGADDVECWERSPLRDRLDAIIFSYQVGVRKPDARIYKYALEAIGVRPEDALFVGDGGSDEHRGARAVGMQTVIVTRLLGSWWPERIAERRLHADWEFEDVPALVEALEFPPPSPDFPLKEVR
jgi:putative hydrolase of the HAD superfamily